MLLSPFRRSRAPRVSVGSQTARLQSLLIAAMDVPSLRDRLARAQLSTLEEVRNIRSPEEALQDIELSERSHYPDALPASRGMRVPYSQARAGLKTNAQSGDLYSLDATSDLLHLANSLQNPGALSESEAIVVFSGLDAGILAETQRDELWQMYGLPIFEQLIDLSGNVIASECEVHDGLHVRVADAIIESVGDELILTSLTNLNAPVLRMRTGLTGTIENECCECGCVEPRLKQLGHLLFKRAKAGLLGAPALVG